MNWKMLFEEIQTVFQPNTILNFNTFILHDG